VLRLLVDGICTCQCHEQMKTHNHLQNGSNLSTDFMSVIQITGMTAVAGQWRPFVANLQLQIRITML
jgi:hypothetical protein